MRRIAVCLLAITVAFPALASSQTVDGDHRRARILEVAERYRTHRWRAAKKHIKHGEDPDGVRVDTPDRAYRRGGWQRRKTNVGLPYMWGGFSSIEDFDAGIRKGKYAGHLPKGRGAQSSRHAVGLDCSGFVSRCWSLPVKQSTRSIGRLCYKLGSHEALEPGDVMNRHNGHVVLFKSFADAKKTKLNVVEAGGTRVHAAVRNIEDLKKQGYVALRYKPLDERWRQEAVRFDKPTWARSQGAEGRFVPDGRTVPFADATSPLDSVSPGEWIRVAIRLTRRGKPIDQVLSLGIAAAGKKIRVHRRLDVGEDAIDQITTYPTDWTFLRTVLAMTFQTGGRNLKLRNGTIETGTFRCANASFAARRLRCAATGVIRRDIPMRLQIDCILSHDAPVLGILEGSFDLETSFPREVVKEKRVLSTLACRRESAAVR